MPARSRSTPARSYGVLHCYDRIVISGNLQPLCYANGMTKYLYRHGIRIFDYTQFAEPLRDAIRPMRKQSPRRMGWRSNSSANKSFRKEERIQAILQRAATNLGWCTSFRPWKAVKPISPGMTKQRAVCMSDDPGKCLHYYFYFIDADLGLCYLRVPTWSPFRLQFYCNGHNVLAANWRKPGSTLSWLTMPFCALPTLTSQRIGGRT